MELHQIIRICQAYTKLGSAVQNQICDLIGGDFEINPNAVELIKRHFLTSLPAGPAKDELAEYIDDFHKASAE